MPDLDQLFRALQADADLIPSPNLSVVRASGRRRRLRHITVGVVAVGMIVGTVVVGPALWSRATRPPADTAPSAATFTPLRAVGGEEVTLDTQANGELKSIASAVADGRGFAAWQDNRGVTTVAAVDIASGRRLWGPVMLDATSGWTGVYALPQAVAVFSVSTDSADFTFTVLDPTTGERLWQRKLHALDGVPYESVLVIADRSTGMTEAVEWRSGRTLWKITDPSGSLLTVLGMRAPKDRSFPGPSALWPYSDPRLVEVGADRVVRVYDVLTGHLLASRTALGNEALAYDGTVFAVRDSTATVPNQVLAYEAVGSDVPRIVYQSPHGTSRLRALAPCGLHRICLVEGWGTNNGADAEVVAVDLDAHASVWRIRSGDLDTLTPVGERVLGRTDGGLVGLYGAGRSSVLVPEGSSLLADRVDDGRVLLLWPATDDATQAARDTDVVGVIVATGERVTLGRIRISPMSCSWDTRFLLCATDTGFQVWRFGAD
jgi:hypothetical protein